MDIKGDGMFLILFITIVAIGEDSNWRFKTNTKVFYEQTVHETIRDTLRRSM
jgi:hypothetical protein